MNDTVDLFRLVPWVHIRTWKDEGRSKLAKTAFSDLLDERFDVQYIT